MSRKKDTVFAQKNFLDMRQYVTINTPKNKKQHMIEMQLIHEYTTKSGNMSWVGGSNQLDHPPIIRDLNHRDKIIY